MPCAVVRSMRVSLMAMLPVARRMCRLQMRAAAAAANVGGQGTHSRQAAGNICTSVNMPHADFVRCESGGGAGDGDVGGENADSS